MMKVSIRDRDALLAVSPAALSAYARVAGWSRGAAYRVHSNLYFGKELPELIVPHTEHLGDYASVVSTLIDTFAEVSGQDALTVYRDLVTADRDVIRLRAADQDHSGSLPLGAGANLVCGARDIILAAARSLTSSQPIYRLSANTEANDYLQQVRLGQTAHGSFVITLLSPVVPPPIQVPQLPDAGLHNEPLARRVTKRVAEALAAARKATDDTSAGDPAAFRAAVRQGVSANMCEALATLIETLPRLDISVVWARTRPRDEARYVTRFASHDAPILRAASEAFRSRAPRADVTLVGLVQRVAQDAADTDGTVTLRTSIEGSNQSVAAVLPRSEYGRVIQAHKTQAPVVMRGDLERTGQRWRLLNPSIEDVIVDDNVPEVNRAPDPSETLNKELREELRAVLPEFLAELNEWRDRLNADELRDQLSKELADCLSTLSGELNREVMKRLESLGVELSKQLSKQLSNELRRLLSLPASIRQVADSGDALRKSFSNPVASSGGGDP